MLTGLGNSFLSHKPEASTPGPPFPANSADNGLSVDAVTGRIVLGDDIGNVLAALLSDREIEMSGFLFRLVEGGSPRLLIDPTNQLYQIGEPLTSAYEIDAVNNLAVQYLNSKAYLYMDEISGFSYFGGDLFNGEANINVSRAGGQIGLSSQDAAFPTNSALGTFLCSGSFPLITFLNGDATTLQQSLNLGSNGLSYAADAFDALNSFDRFNLDAILRLYSIGENSLGQIFKMEVDANAGEFKFEDTANLSAIRINGQLGFTGTVTPVTSITVEGGIVTAVT